MSLFQEWACYCGDVLWQPGDLISHSILPVFTWPFCLVTAEPTGPHRRQCHALEFPSLWITLYYLLFTPSVVFCYSTENKIRQAVRPLHCYTVLNLHIWLTLWGHWVTFIQCHFLSISFSRNWMSIDKLILKSSFCFQTTCENGSFNRKF